MHFILIYILFNITISQLSVESTPQSIIRGLNTNVPTFNTPQFNLSDIIDLFFFWARLLASQSDAQ